MWLSLAFWAAITQAGSSARFVRRVVLEVALGGGPPADRAGTGGVPDLGQVPELNARIVAPAFKPVVAVLRGERVEGDQQVRPIAGGVQPPGSVAAGRPVPAGRGEGEPRRPWPRAFPVTLGHGSGTAVADSVPVLVGHRHAPGAFGVGRGGGGGQVAGQPGIDGAEPGQFARPSGQTSQGGQRDCQVGPPGEPVRCRADRVGLVLAGAGVFVQEQVKQGAGTNRVYAAF